MTDLTRTFIPVASDEANARSFLETLSGGSDDAKRLAREDACQLARMLERFTQIAPRLWAEMLKDMRSLIDEARAGRGYADISDLNRAGYSDEVIVGYLRHQNPESQQGDAA
ncbi:hypothetical protein [Hoeflea sp. EC-HK425]|uniref:hypothetical protein n=1 Tax=Hoeflea sp. EC-HK425 TaxID=2038388 RepID=UPI00125183B3|nr:hypothetical protein [Hoeflea sp. EC-HK425]VVT15382.1 hypothetical protein HOE425_331223 [Hoeflea sp. EC-HK425]